MLGKKTERGELGNQIVGISLPLLEQNNRDGAVRGIKRFGLLIYYAEATNF